MAYVFCVVVLLSVAVADPDNCKNCGVKIPLEMALRLNTITDEKQLFREFKIQDVEKPVVALAKFPLGFGPDSGAGGTVSSFFKNVWNKLKLLKKNTTVADEVDGMPKASTEEEPVERKAVMKPSSANCIPELRSVSLKQSEDPWIVYWPICTRVEQCGGCCTHQLLKCQPVETETLNFQVTVMEYTGSRMRYKGKEIVSVEKHTKCKCDCIVKESDCNELQEYKKGECRCLCTNKDEEAKCNADTTKHWNPDNCSCECLNVMECSTGTYYNQSSCSCEALPDETSLYAERYPGVLFSNADNTTLARRPSSPPRRRWPPNYSFGGK